MVDVEGRPVGPVIEGMCKRRAFRSRRAVNVSLRNQMFLLMMLAFPGLLSMPVSGAYLTLGATMELPAKDVGMVSSPSFLPHVSAPTSSLTGKSVLENAPVYSYGSQGPTNQTYPVPPCHPVATCNSLVDDLGATSVTNTLMADGALASGTPSVSASTDIAAGSALLGGQAYNCFSSEFSGVVSGIVTNSLCEPMATPNATQEGVVTSIYGGSDGNGVNDSWNLASHAIVVYSNGGKTAPNVVSKIRFFAEALAGQDSTLNLALYAGDVYSGMGSLQAACGGCTYSDFFNLTGGGPVTNHGDVQLIASTTLSVNPSSTRGSHYPFLNATPGEIDWTPFAYGTDGSIQPSTGYPYTAISLVAWIEPSSIAGASFGGKIGYSQVEFGQSASGASGNVPALPSNGGASTQYTTLGSIFDSWSTGNATSTTSGYASDYGFYVSSPRSGWTNSGSATCIQPLGFFSTSFACAKTDWVGVLGLEATIPGLSSSSVYVVPELGKHGWYDVAPNGERTSYLQQVCGCLITAFNIPIPFPTGVTYTVNDGYTISNTQHAMSFDTSLFGYEGTQVPATGAIAFPANSTLPWSYLANSTSANITWIPSISSPLIDEFHQPVVWTLPLSTGKLGFATKNVGQGRTYDEGETQGPYNTQTWQPYLNNEGGCPVGANSLVNSPVLSNGLVPFQSSSSGVNSPETGPGILTPSECVDRMTFDVKPSVPFPIGIFCTWNASTAGNGPYCPLNDGSISYADQYVVSYSVPGYAIRQVIGPVGLVGQMDPYLWRTANSTANGNGLWMNELNSLDSNLCAGYAFGKNASSQSTDCSDPLTGSSSYPVLDAPWSSTPLGTNADIGLSSLRPSDADAFEGALPPYPRESPDYFPSGGPTQEDTLIFDIARAPSGDLVDPYAMEWLIIMSPMYGAEQLMGNSVTTCSGVSNGGGNTSLCNSGSTVYTPVVQGTYFPGAATMVKSQTLGQLGLASGFVANHTVPWVPHTLPAAQDPYDGYLSGSSAYPAYPSNPDFGPSYTSGSSYGSVSNDSTWWSLSGATDSIYPVTLPYAKTGFVSSSNLSGYWRYSENIGRGLLPLGNYSFVVNSRGLPSIEQDLPIQSSLLAFENWSYLNFTGGFGNSSYFNFYDLSVQVWNLSGTGLMNLDPQSYLQIYINGTECWNGDNPVGKCGSPGQVALGNATQFGLPGDGIWLRVHKHVDWNLKVVSKLDAAVVSRYWPACEGTISNATCSNDTFSTTLGDAFGCSNCSIQDIAIPLQWVSNPSWCVVSGWACKTPPSGGGGLIQNPWIDILIVLIIALAVVALIYYIWSGGREDLAIMTGIGGALVDGAAAWYLFNSQYTGDLYWILFAIAGGVVIGIGVVFFRKIGRSRILGRGYVG